MRRSILILVLAVTTVHAGELAIQSPDQAVLRLRQARDTELKGSFQAIDRADSLSIQRMHPSDFQPPHRDPVFGDTDPSRFFGSFAAVVGSKSDTWLLKYDFGLLGGMAFYLAADTGKILYAYHIPEG